MLFLCRSRAWVLLDVSRNGDRLDVFELLEAGLVAPSEKLIDGAVVGLTGIGISDRCHFRQDPSAQSSGEIWRLSACQSPFSAYRRSSCSG
jgi:hypothetical protein